MFGWAGSCEQFLATDTRQLIATLRRRDEELHLRPPSGEQKRAWRSQIACLNTNLTDVADSRSWGLILEYELPFEGGRRTDAVVLARDRVLALEFKEAASPTAAAVDQTKAYARDLAEYHSVCRDRVVLPILALPSARELTAPMDGGRVASCDRLASVFGELSGAGEQISADSFLAGRYDPLPTLIQAARRVFRSEPLPAIKRAESAGVPALLAWLHALVAEAREERTRHLVLITGVPGSGKTLVGLQFVHESEADESMRAIFLSGNDPLVSVLQDALGSKVFVQRMHNYILDFGVRARTLPPFHVVVFDEAQRAWDREHMQQKKDHPRSEPEILMQLAQSLPDWSVVIGLVGEGQEIYLGEEAGLEQWKDAVEQVGGMVTVHLPPRLASKFDGLSRDIRREFDLTISLRTHRAEYSQAWLAELMQGNIEEAGRLARQLEENDFDLYVTTDLPLAKRYLRNRYLGEPLKRYGLLASSRARNLRSLGVDNEFNATRRLKIAKWFNAPAEDPVSACQLSDVVTEFQCQGLELDMPLVCWGDDLGWDGRWVEYRHRRSAHDSFRLLLNTYRVLLSRGRDGVIVYLPSTLSEGQLERLMEVLTESGFRRLPG